jgi:hypothetical protein
VTLILNLINREHAIQVSDRCFTWFREDGAIEHTEDEHNKAVVFKDRFVFSYAGLGELPGCGRTDDWLASVLHDFDISLAPCDHDQARVFATVAERATEAFGQREMGRLHPARRRHLFVAICWGRFPPGFDRFEPYLMVISNFHTGDGSELALPLDHFEVLPPQRLRDPDTTRLAWFGARLGASERRALNAVKRLNPGGPGFAVAAIRLMAEQVRSVARRKRTVGGSLVAAAVPRDAVGVGAREEFLSAGRPLPTVRRSCICLAASSAARCQVAIEQIGGSLLLLARATSRSAGTVSAHPSSKWPGAYSDARVAVPDRLGRERRSRARSGSLTLEPTPARSRFPCALLHATWSASLRSHVALTGATQAHLCP